MNIIAVDDERLVLRSLVEAIREAVPGCRLEGFQNAEEALLYAGEHYLDAAFLDIQMNETNGLSLAEQLKSIHPRINIIFVTGYSEYARDALRLRASGYLEKPVMAKDIVLELANLRHPLKSSKRIWVRCFGNFEVWVDGQPLIFGRTKSKEILAYLVDRKGAGVTKRELAAVIWEDQHYTRNTQYYLQKLIAHMVEVLRAAGAEQMIVKERNYYGVNPAVFDCDYYDFCEGKEQSEFRHSGEYMTNYSWAEVTLGSLK